MTTATATRTLTTYFVRHGNCVTLHDSLDEAMQVYRNGGCTSVVAETTEYLMDDTGFILEARIETNPVV